MIQTSLLVFGVGYVVIFGGLTAWLASTKNRDGCSRFVLGALIGPLALIADGLAPAPQPGTKVCPQCAEEVKSAALVCRFCHNEFATSVIRYTGGWRVLASDVDALSAGDDVSVVVDDETLQVLKANAVAYEAPVAEVTASGSSTDTRLRLPDGKTVLLDWWAGEDGHRLRSALLRM